MAKSRAICPPWRGTTTIGNSPPPTPIPAKKCFLGKIEPETIFLIFPAGLATRIGLWMTKKHKKHHFFFFIIGQKSKGNSGFGRETRYKGKNDQKSGHPTSSQGQLSAHHPHSSWKVLLWKDRARNIFFFNFLARLATRIELWMTKKHKKHHFFSLLRTNSPGLGHIYGRFHL